MAEAIFMVGREAVPAGNAADGLGGGRGGDFSSNLNAGEKVRTRMGIAVHDLCQPLTALRCRLELAQMEGVPDELLETLRDSLEQCNRLTAAVGNIRRVMLQM